MYMKMNRSLKMFNSLYTLRKYCLLEWTKKYQLNKYVAVKRHFFTSYPVKAKMFEDHENSYAFQSMVASKYIGEKFTDITTIAHNNESIEDINAFLKENWREKSTQYICDAFHKLSNYCSENQICISSEKFDNIVDALTDSIKNVSDEELEKIFGSLKKWPVTPSVKTHNFIEVWAALDDACLARYKSWSIDDLLKFSALTFKLSTVRSGEFMLKCTQRLCYRAKYMSPEQLVQTYFYISLTRKAPIEMHSMETFLRKQFNEFNSNDLGIIAMGYFKSRTQLRDMTLVNLIIQRVIEEAKNVNEISLAAILKLIRFSAKNTQNNILINLLTILEDEIPRLSLMCCVHIALLGTATLAFNENCIDKVAKKACDNISNARAKDLERLILTFVVFDHKNDELCKKTIEEFRKEERQNEINNYGRTFACCVSYLTMLEYYPLDLIQTILEPKFLIKTYGTNSYTYGREILTLNNTVDIFFPEYKGHRLNEKTVRLLSNKYTDFVPNEDYKKAFNVAERVFIDVVKLLREDRGGKEFVCGDHILTHHQRGDIIVCSDTSGRPLPITPHFPLEHIGPIPRPPNDNVWTVLVLAGRNGCVRENNKFTGPFITKRRELQALGYSSALIAWYIWAGLQSDAERLSYLNNLIKDATASVKNK